MWNTIILTLAIVLIAVVLLGIKVLFVKNGKFPNIHIGANKAMRKKGISCALSTDANERKQTNLTDRLNEEK